jgi:hypothetical protein
MSMPDERIKTCMAGAATFFKYLGHVREMFMSERGVTEWGGVMFSAGMMRESLSYLKACDPELPVDELKHRVHTLYYAASTENRALAGEALRAIERFFEQRYGELLDELERKGDKIMNTEVIPWIERRRRAARE